MRTLLGLSVLALSACQSTTDTRVEEKPAVAQVAGTPAAWANTLPQYPILHDRTINRDLWVFTHDAINTCGTSSDHVRIWAVRKRFSDGKTFPDMVLNPKPGRIADEAFIAAVEAYIVCAQAVAKKYKG